MHCSVVPLIQTSTILIKIVQYVPFLSLKHSITRNRLATHVSDPLENSPSHILNCGCVMEVGILSPWGLGEG